MSFSSSELETKYIPSRESSKAAVLLLVHGRGGRFQLMEWFSKRAQNIKSLDFLCVQAPHPEFVPEMKVPGFSWYLGKEKEGLAVSRQKLKRLYEELVEYGYPREKIFWLGFSQGGVMGLDFALRSDAKVGGVVCVSGFCLEYDKYPAELGAAGAQQNLIATHGRRDEIVDFDRAKKSYDWLIKHKIPLEFFEFNKPHSFDLKEEIPFLLSRLEEWISA